MRAITSVVEAGPAGRDHGDGEVTLARAACSSTCFLLSTLLLIAAPGQLDSGRNTMYRAEVEPMPENPPDRVQYTGLWKVVIYEANGLFARNRDRITHSMATRLAEELNFQFGHKRKAKDA